jgi:hypothetical protein
MCDEVSAAAVAQARIEELSRELASAKAEIEALKRQPEGPLPIGPLLDARLQPGLSVVLNSLDGRTTAAVVPQWDSQALALWPWDEAPCPSVALRSVLLQLPAPAPDRKSYQLVQGGTIYRGQVGQ